jgi:hypothetical protein
LLWLKNKKVELSEISSGRRNCQIGFFLSGLGFGGSPYHLTRLELRKFLNPDGAEGFSSKLALKHYYFQIDFLWPSHFRHFLI